MVCLACLSFFFCWSSYLLRRSVEESKYDLKLTDRAVAAVWILFRLYGFKFEYVVVVDTDLFGFVFPGSVQVYAITSGVVPFGTSMPPVRFSSIPT